VGRGGFEPPKALPTDLQSVPFDRSGTFPFTYITGKATSPTNLKKHYKKSKEKWNAGMMFSGLIEINYHYSKIPLFQYCYCKNF
jgi:hypothetical protein